MPTSPQRSARRKDALSKERIVATAIEILDAEGEAALTFRALSTRLATGAGAIYWHVANKDELLAATTNDVITRAMKNASVDGGPGAAIRAAALAAFDAIDAHPWAGTQLVREPWQPAIRHILEAVGTHLDGLGVPKHAQFNASTTLLTYILGTAGQYAAGMRFMHQQTDRVEALTSVAQGWSDDGDVTPFVREMAAQLPEHDDREQFIAGVEMILTGIAAIS
jgi:AcrR family transcriptional regulator